jgi:hypothetical protein
MLSQLAARNECARASEQQMQNLKWLLLQFHSEAPPPELAILHIQIENSKSDPGYFSLQISSSTKSLDITTLDPDIHLIHC